MSFGNRNEGLVRRKVQVAAPTSEEHHEESDNQGSEKDEEDHDSKETRLTLMEEVLLLGLKDREVKSKTYKFQQFFIKQP